MAIVNITFDTNSKECSVAVDNKVVEDVDSLTIYKYDKVNSFHMSLKPREEDGMTGYISVVASESEKSAKAIEKQDFSEDGSLVSVHDEERLQAKINDWLVKK